MQVKPHPSDQSARRVWLNHNEIEQLLDYYSEYPQRRAALMCGLHGLRSAEIMGVKKENLRKIQTNGDIIHKLFVPESDAKTTKAEGSNARDTPISEELFSLIRTHINSTRKRKDEPMIDVGQRQVRRWIESARNHLMKETGVENWEWLSMHDLRRTWATDTFWSLAIAGNPAAEELTMSWGGWAKTAAGTETFRQNYLGPVPDHITVQAAKDLDYL